MTDLPADPAAMAATIAADAVMLAEPDGGTGRAVALGCCDGEDTHAPTERIRAGSIGTGARQLRAVIREVLGS